MEKQRQTTFLDLLDKLRSWLFLINVFLSWKVVTVYIKLEC